MANLVPPSPSSPSRLPHVRRAGIGLCALAALLGGLGHVIGWRSTMTIAAVITGIVLLFLAIRAVRNRRSGGLPRGLRGLPRGLPGGLRGGRGPGFPRGLGRIPRGGLRVPRGMGRARLPGGMRPPLPRGMRVPAGARSRMPGLAARGGRAAGTGRKAGLPGGSRSRFRPQRGAPAFRASRASTRAGARPGARAGSPGFARTGSRPGSRSSGGLPRSGSSRAGRRSGIGAGGVGSRSRAGSRFGGSRSGGGSPGAPARVRGLRRIVPPRMRPASWTGGTPAPARGWRRLIPPRLRPSAPGTVPRPSAGGARSRGRHGPPGFMPYRARVRRRWLRRRGRRVNGPKPVRTHRLRPFTQAWLLHHIGRYGRRRVRRQAMRQARRVSRPVRARRYRVRNGVRKMQAFLISLRHKKNKAQAPGAPAGPAVTIRPPNRSADPDAHRRPRPATPRRGPVPRPASPAGASFAGQPNSPTGGSMPNVNSSPIEQVVEAISALANFTPETVVPEVEGLLENLHKIPDALAEALKKVAGKLEEMPVDRGVPDAVRELVSPLGGLSERAGEAYDLFKKRHEQELDQHYNPRSNEAAWNKR